MGIFPKCLSIKDIWHFLLFFILSKSKKYSNQNQKMQSANKKIKLAIKHEEDMKKPLSKINEDPEAYRTRFNPPMYDEALIHINPQEPIAFDWEKFHKDNGIVPKPAGTTATYTPSAAALAIAAAKKERVAKRTAEEAFDKVHSLKKSIRELDGKF